MTTLLVQMEQQAVEEVPEPWEFRLAMAEGGARATREAAREALQLRNELVRQARREGIASGDIRRATGLSRQRVTQITRSL